MLLINIKTKKIISEWEFRQEHKNIIFPSNLITELISDFDYAIFKKTNPPEYDNWYYELVEDEAKLIDGEWIQQWKLEPITHTPEEELNRLNTFKQNKLNILNSKFLEAENNGALDSSVGFTIDATERSKRDIDGLIELLEATKTETTLFCAADNTFHDVTLEQLKTMKLEVIKYGQELYQKKWTYREQINQAQTKEELDTIEIKF